MIKRRILMVFPQAPFPATSGAQMRLAQFLRLLNDSYSIHFICLSPHPLPSSGKELLDSWGVSYDLIEHTGYSPRIHAFFPKPRAVYSYLSQRLHSVLEQRLASYQPHILQIEFTWMAQYLPRLRRNYKSVLVEHDTSWLMLKRHYHRLAWGFKRLAGYLDAFKMRSYERAQLARFDRIIALTEEDRALLQKECRSASIQVITQGVDTEYFSPDRSVKRGNGLVFTGNMSHYPNKDAMITFCHEYLPVIRRLVNNVPLTIVGRAPDADVKALESIPGVTVTGEVPDVRSYLARGDIFICPMFAGGGMRGKILEAMAMETPVVTTRMGCEGIEAEPMRHVLIADNAEGFALAIKKVYSDVAFARKIASEARILVCERYTWKQQAEKLALVYEELASEIQ